MVTRAWTALNGVNGISFTGYNGNTLFIPAAGYKYNGTISELGTSSDLRSTSIRTDKIHCAWYMFADSGSVAIAYISSRPYGLSCRGVVGGRS